MANVSSSSLVVFRIGEQDVALGLVPALIAHLVFVEPDSDQGLGSFVAARLRIAAE